MMRRRMVRSDDDGDEDGDEDDGGRLDCRGRARRNNCLRVPTSTSYTSLPSSSSLSASSASLSS